MIHDIITGARQRSPVLMATG